MEITYALSRKPPPLRYVTTLTNASRLQKPFGPSFNVIKRTVARSSPVQSSLASPIKSRSSSKQAGRFCVCSHYLFSTPGSTRATCHILNTGSAWQWAVEAATPSASQSTSAARSRHGLGASTKAARCFERKNWWEKRLAWWHVGIPEIMLPLPACRSALRCWVLLHPQIVRSSSQGSRRQQPTHTNVHHQACE